MDYHYKTGCHVENLKGVRDFVRDTLRPFGISETAIAELVLALDEMCSNLIIHAHHCNPNDLFEIIIYVIKGKPVIFEIVDDGTVFDINQFSEPDLGNLVHEKRKGGLGIRLVKTIMDKVEYQHREGKNVCRLSKGVVFNQQ